MDQRNELEALVNRVQIPFANMEPAALGMLRLGAHRLDTLNATASRRKADHRLHHLAKAGTNVEPGDWPLRRPNILEHSAKSPPVDRHFPTAATTDNVPPALHLIVVTSFDALINQVLRWARVDIDQAALIALYCGEPVLNDPWLRIIGATKWTWNALDRNV
jgi:hypothetical protein